MESQNRVVEGDSQSDPTSETGLEESVWQLGLGGGNEMESYPERPDEADCIHYLRTGFCGYGSRCRFNHPRDRGWVMETAKAGATEFPERVGQPVCQYYTRTRMCKFGASCKYYHPREGSSYIGPVLLNFQGYPLRLGEKECSYYVKTGQCKFGVTCKFHHPNPPIQIPSPSPLTQQFSSMNPTVHNPSAPSTQQYGVVVARSSLLPGSYVESPCGPFVLSPGMVPIPGWSPYLADDADGTSPSSQPAVISSSIYGRTPLSPSAPAYYQSGPSVDPSSDIHKEHLFPDRPGEPECQYYMKTGNCKFGSSCRYHHPREGLAQKINVLLSPIGLPLRPGAPPCTHYIEHGICKFGASCKFHHPMGTLIYSPSASSLTNMPIAPYPPGSSIDNLAPLSSSSNLQPESISTKNSPPISTSGESVGPMISENE